MTEEQRQREELLKKVRSAYDTNRAVLIEAGTGVGKTKLGLELLKEKQRWLIVVPKLVLIDSWKDEIKKHGFDNLLPNIEFITYASLEKFAESRVKRNVILDEAHHVNERRYVAIRKIVNISDKVGPGRGRVIALSATIDPDRLYLLGGLGIRKHNTIKFNIDKAVEADLVADYQAIVVHIPLDDVNIQPLRYNKWKTIYNQTEAQVYETLNAEYKKLFKAGGDTKWIVLDRMKFIYDSPSKARAARIINNQLSRDRRVLTFGSSINQIEELCEYTHHSKKSKKDTTLKDFCEGHINRLGAVNTVSEGVNIPNLDTGFIVQAMSKSRHVAQRTGRLLRKDKDNPTKKAVLIVLALDETKDNDWVMKSLSYLDYSKIHHTTINEVETLGIEKIIRNL